MNYNTVVKSVILITSVKFLAIESACVAFIIPELFVPFRFIHRFIVLNLQIILSKSLVKWALGLKNCYL